MLATSLLFPVYNAVHLRHFIFVCYRFLGLPWSIRQESPCNAGDLDSIPGLRRSPGGGQGNSLQNSCLENPHEQRSLAGYSPWGRKESDTTEQLSTAHLQNTQPLPTTVIGTCWTLSHRCLSPGPLLSPHKSPPFALVPVLSRAAKGTLFKLS